MGTYRSWRVRANVQDDAEIINWLKGKNAEDVWNEFTSPSKWWALEEIGNLSIAFPSTVFMVEMAEQGSEPYLRRFYLNGKSLREDTIYSTPQIPTKRQFENAMGKFCVKRKKELAEAELAEKKLKKEEKAARIQELKSELSTLEAHARGHKGKSKARKPS